MSAGTTWSTRIRNPYNGAVHHLVFFQPADDRGEYRRAVAIQIPEASDSEICLALKQAHQRGARLIFLCNTANEAAAVAGMTTQLLPRHRRISLERALAGGWDTS